MADNMIKLIASLDIEESVPIINKQIDRLQRSGKLNSIKIDVKLDESIKELKTQLESLAKMPQSNALKVMSEQAQNLGSKARRAKVEIADLNRELSSGSKAYSVGNNGIPKYLDLRGSTEQRKLDAKTLIGNSLDDTESKVSRIHIATENAKGTLKDFKVQVEKENGSLEVLTYRLTKAGGAYEYVGKKIREATNATNFRSTPIDTQVELQTQRLNTFVLKMEKAGASASQLGVDVDGLRNKLNNVGTDANRMGEFLNSMDVAEKKLKTFNTELQNQKATQRFNNGLQSAQNKLQSFAQTYKRAINSNATMTTLSGQTTTFSAAFDEMRNRVVRSDTELKQLNADMRNFTQQATNAGYKGASAFDKFGQSFKLISTYISANRIISMVTREVQEAVEELKNVDNILTEISKTSNITNENLKQLGKDSFDTASEYGRKASDYLLGVQEFSRAGYSEEQAKSMAELSLKAQAAGDLTAELANEYIIATGAAYELSGNEEKLNDVLDRQNYITNRNPVSMEKLATATKLVASQAHASNVEIDEMTAALGTMSAVTQQSGEVSARAFRGVLMNLQQVKASAEDIGDGGEAITASSLSKYEKATKELGVSLKEVKNGTLQLRKPMEVLRDLSIAVGKEGENSIKVANLLSAVGGKYRANQLNALLTHWDSYEKMLAEYNSDNAINSAAEEATKSANNWSGSLNKLRNSWDKLVNNVVNSERAISIINALTSGVQSLGDSSAIKEINALGDAIFDLGEKAGKALDNPFGDFIKSGFKFGVGSVTGWKYPMLVGKVSDFFSNDSSNEDNEQDTLRKKYLDGLSQEENSTDSLVSQYTSLVNNTDELTDAKEELANVQDKLIDKYGDENSKLDLLNGNIKQNIDDIVALKKAQSENFLNDNQSVVDNAKATFGIENFGDKSFISHRAALLNVGDMLDGDKLKDEAKTEIKIYTETIKKYLKDNYRNIYKNISIVGDEKFGDIGFAVKDGLSPEEQLKTAQAIVEAYRNAANSRESITRNLDIEAVLKSNDVWLKKLTEDFKILEDAEKKQKDQNLWSDFENSKDYEKYSSLIERIVEYNNKLNDSSLSVADRYKNGLEISDAISELDAIAEKYPVVESTIEQALSGIGLAFDTTTESLISAKESWVETLDEAQKGVLSNVDKISDAMVKLYSGESIESKNAWDIINLDSSNILSNIEMDDNGKYIFDLKQIVQLKDKILQQEIQQRKETLAELELQKTQVEANLKLEEKNLARLSAQAAPNSMATNTKHLKEDIERSTTVTRSYREALESLNYSIKNYSLYIGECEGKLGDLSNTQEVASAKAKALDKIIAQLNKNISALKDEVSDLQKEADSRLKAQEYVVDSIIKKYEDEAKAIEKSKEALEEQLENLNEQKSELEKIVSNYENVSNAVSKTIDNQIEAIEKERKALEDSYNERIDKLKSENDERKDAIEYEQKLANLANAKNNKVHTYSSETGWNYEVDKIAIDKAQNELDDYKNNKKISNLEKERDKRLKPYDSQIKEYEQYAKEWESIVDEIQGKDNERIATEILGQEWREKIKSKDTDILGKYKTDFQQYNSRLNNLVNSEINSLEKSIKAKDKEIKAKEKQIKVWQDYKNELSSAVDVINGKLGDYQKYLNDVNLSEDSNAAQRNANLDTFKQKYSDLITTISSKNSEIEIATQKMNDLTETANNLKEATLNMPTIEPAMGGIQIGGNPSLDTGTVGGALAGIGALTTSLAIDQLLMDIKAAFEKMFNGLPRFAKGGAADFTGLAQLDGSPSSTETIFTAAQSKKLYNYVESMPDFNAFNYSSLGSKTVNNSSNVTIGQMTVMANNPQDFATQFKKQMSTYLQTELTKSQIY